MSDEDAIGESFFDVSGLPEDDGDDEIDEMVGAVLDGRFRLERLLGEGGMGRVYAGTQLSVEREVAVKLLRAEALVQREVKERFLREAQVISGFGHPNIVRLIDYGEDDTLGLPYLVMELVRGVSLGELTRRGRLQLPLALEIIDQVCSGLIQAHSAGIVHRDLKPDNLKLLPVVGGSFQTKVLDFGVAFPSDTNSRLTSTGMICGTAHYIAPEQARAHELDGRADLYALGIILFEMLTGQLPFGGDSDFQILLMQVQKPPPSLSDFIPEDKIPTPVVELVDDLLEKEPEARPDSAREVRERIKAIRAECDIPALELDLEDDSAEAFDPWLLERADSHAVVEASGPVDASLARKELERLEEGGDKTRKTLVEDERPPASEAETSPSSESAPEGSKRGLALAVAAVVLLAGAAGAALFLWPPSTSTDETRATTSRADEPSDDAQPAAVAVEDEPLSSFAGRCTVIGDSDAWFYSVFLYPEVGELLLEGDDKLAWSSVEVSEHRGDSITFDYQPAEADEALSVRVEKRGDRLAFEMPGEARILCRRDDAQRYYDTIGVSGTFEADEQTAVLPSSGQRFEVGEHRYTYRILSGSKAASGLSLAVRDADDRQASWARWTLTVDEEDAELSLGPDGDAKTYVEAGHRAKKAARQQKSDQQARQAAASQKAASKSAQQAASPPPPVAASNSSGLSQEEVTRYRKRIEKVADRCKTHMDRMKATSDRLSNLGDEVESPDEIKPLAEKLRGDLEHHGEMIRVAADEYTELMREVSLSGVNQPQMMGLSSIYTSRCKWE
jgi:serine/threonine protein kinase